MSTHKNDPWGPGKKTIPRQRRNWTDHLLTVLFFIFLVLLGVLFE